jgi:hypothetical protein
MQSTDDGGDNQQNAGGNSGGSARQGPTIRTITYTFKAENPGGLERIQKFLKVEV